MKSFKSLHDEFLNKPDPVYHCENCGDRVYEDENLVDFNGTTLCSDCYNELPVCEQCGTTLSEGDAQSEEEGYFCDSECYDNYRVLNESVGTQ